MIVWLDISTGSPFMVEMSVRGKTHSLGGGMIRTPLGQPANVHIDPRKAGAIAETALVEVIGKSTSKYIQGLKLRR